MKGGGVPACVSGPLDRSDGTAELRQVLEQQRLNHEEVMAAMQLVMKRIEPRSDTSGDGPSKAAGHRDAELHAARARISDLELQVHTLQSLLESKERTIRRLSDISLASVASRVKGSDQSSPDGSPQIVPRALALHQASAEQVMQINPSLPVRAYKDILESHHQRCTLFLASASVLRSPDRKS